MFILSTLLDTDDRFQVGVGFHVGFAIPECCGHPSVVLVLYAPGRQHGVLGLLGMLLSLIEDELGELHLLETTNACFAPCIWQT